MNFTILCAHFVDISSCDEESFMHDNAMDEVDVLAPIRNTLLQNLDTSSLETTLGEDILDGVASLFIESHIL